MTDTEMIRRLLMENFALKDQLRDAKSSSDVWYQECQRLEKEWRLQANTTESNDDIPLTPGKEAENNLPLSPEGTNAKCKTIMA